MIQLLSGHCNVDLLLILLSAWILAFSLSGVDCCHFIIYWHQYAKVIVKTTYTTACCHVAITTNWLLALYYLLLLVNVKDTCSLAATHALALVDYFFLYFLAACYPFCCAWLLPYSSFQLFCYHSCCAAHLAVAFIDATVIDACYYSCSLLSFLLFLFSCSL